MKGNGSSHTPQGIGEAEARYRALVELAPIVVYEWEFGDPGRWRYLSPRVEELLGYGADEFLADPDLWWNRIHEDDREDVLAGEAESQKAAEGTTVEYRMRHRDGKIVWVRDEAIAFDDPHEEQFFRGILSDITLEKEAQTALAALNAELEQRVRDRTAELETTNRDLRAAKETAERASRAKSEFLSRASHELRTPLNAILGFGQLLEATDLSPRDLESVAHILAGGRKLLELINDILDISTVQAGELSLSIEPVAIDDVVKEAVASAQAQAAARGVRLEIGESPRDLFVFADRQRLRQVVTYLLANAIRFNDEGGSVRVTWSSDADATRLRLVDTGQGIRSEDIERLFGVFERIDQGSSNVGTGLGLPLAKALTEAMGGTISAESVLGQGTTVTLKLASSRDPMDSIDRADTSGTAVRGTTAHTILCIEDNLANIALVQGILEHRPGITLLRAMHGGTGVQLAMDHLPDLVLLDLHLPDMPGEEALARLRAAPRTKDIPVIAVSAETDSRAIERLQTLGIQGFVNKPIDVERFLELIDTALDPAEEGSEEDPAPAGGSTPR
jgi:PAS domain S-box-containing protein